MRSLVDIVNELREYDTEREWRTFKTFSCKTGNTRCRFQI